MPVNNYLTLTCAFTQWCEQVREGKPRVGGLAASVCFLLSLEKAGPFHGRPSHTAAKAGHIQLHPGYISILSVMNYSI